MRKKKHGQIKLINTLYFFLKGGSSIRRDMVVFIRSKEKFTHLVSLSNQHLDFCPFVISQIIMDIENDSSISTRKLDRKLVQLLGKN